MKLPGRAWATSTPAKTIVLRTITGLRRSTPQCIVLSEVGQTSRHTQWWLRAVGFCNRLVCLSQDALHRRVAIADCHDAIHLRVHNWAWCFRKGLRKLGYTLTLQDDDLAEVHVSQIRELLQAKDFQDMQDVDPCPRTCPSQGAVACAYVRCSHDPAGSQTPFASRRYCLFQPMPSAIFSDSVRAAMAFPVILDGGLMYPACSVCARTVPVYATLAT